MNRNRDPYLYDDAPVLKNKLNIKDEDELDKAESTITRIKLIDAKNVKGNFDFQHLMDIHRHIFGDIYDWAGNPRIIDIYKNEIVLGGATVLYSHYADIESDLKKAIELMKEEKWGSFKTIEQQATAISKHLTRIWEIHPFREGNTRTTTEFMIQFAESKNIFIDREIFSKNAQYARDSYVMYLFGEEKYLLKIMTDAIEIGQQNNRTSVKNKIQNAKNKSVRKNNSVQKIFNDIDLEP